MIPAEYAGMRERPIPLYDSWDRAPSGLYLPPDARPAIYGDKLLAIDLFCGCGGFSLGFMQAGCRVVAAIDNDPIALMTYCTNLATYPVAMHFVTDADKDRFARELERENRRRRTEDKIETPVLAGTGWIASHPEAEGVPHVWFGDARKVKGQDFLDALGLRRGDIHCVIGGPPCQGFSTAGRRDVMDPRNSLVFEFARLVLEIWPKTFVMENVPGLASMKTPEGDRVLHQFMSVLADGGFAEYDALRQALDATGGKVAYRGSKGHAEKDDDEAVEDEDETASQLQLVL